MIKYKYEDSKKFGCILLQVLQQTSGFRNFEWGEYSIRARSYPEWSEKNPRTLHVRGFLKSKNLQVLSINRLYWPALKAALDAYNKRTADRRKREKRVDKIMEKTKERKMK